MTVPFRIRDRVEADIPFLFSSWLNSSFDASLENALGFKDGSHFAHHKRIVEALLARSVVLVACEEDDEDHVLGWFCFELLPENVVAHYAYVKNGYRRLGVFRRLWQVANPDNQRAFVSTVGRVHQDLLKAGWPLVHDPHVLKELLKQ